MIKRKNFTSFALSAIPLDTEYDSCNFSRNSPDLSGAEPEPWDLFPGYAGPPILFRDCNLINVRPPAGSILEFCNTALIQYGLIDREETLVIDGVERGPRRTYSKRIVYGRVNPQTFAKELKPTPEEFIKERPNR